MKIYTIKHNEFIQESYLGHVIVANNKKEARELAKERSADEGKNIWDKAEIVIEGEYVGKNKRPFIMLSDYRSYNW